MRDLSFKSFMPHLIALVAFVLVAVVFCKPALEGKVLQQSDNIQWKAMYENQRQYEEKTGELPLWTNGMFSGMPGYQIAMKAPNYFSVGYLFDVLTLGMPKPFYFFILASVCFYIFSLILKVNPYLAIVGSLSYAYATYNPIIVSVGHETKMICVAYIPALIGSIILLYERKYLIGTALTATFSALMIGANHPQISYYTFIVIFFMTVGYAITWIRKKEFKHLFSALGLGLCAGILGLLSNAVVLATTYEYSKESIRGGSVLADEKSNNNKTGLNKEYALSYSFFVTEPLVMMFPRIYGGSNGHLEVAEDKSKAIEALQQMPGELGQQLQGYLQFYWGGITQGTAGPPYSGAIVCFLALLGLTVLPNKHKWWMIAAILLSFLMSAGLYLEKFNVFLLDHLPLYNKFRAPSMIMVVPTFLFVMAAVIAGQQLLFGQESKALIEKYKKGLLVIVGVFALAGVLYLGSDFRSANDSGLLDQVNQITDPQQRNAILQPVKSFLNGLEEDRKGLFLSDLMRSLVLIVFAAGAIWLFLKKQIKPMLAVAVIGILSLFDLLSIDSNYLNENNYQDAEEYDQVFTPAPHNIEIARDTGNYRVLDISQGIGAAFNGNAITSVFHQSVGGYHAAKLSIYQDLIEKQLYKFPDCMPVVNMLNTKYIIFRDPSSGQIQYQQNTNAAGSCWMVKEVRQIATPAGVMKALDSLNVLDHAIVETNTEQPIRFTNGDTVILQKNSHDQIEYTASSTLGGFAVFSEVYYSKGWKAFIDEKETPIYKTNYVLRGLYIPAGDHKIRFEFRPASYYKTVPVSIGANISVWILLMAAAGFSIKKKK